MYVLYPSILRCISFNVSTSPYLLQISQAIDDLWHSLFYSLKIQNLNDNLYLFLRLLTSVIISSLKYFQEGPEQFNSESIFSNILYFLYSWKGFCSSYRFWISMNDFYFHCQVFNVSIILMDQILIFYSSSHWTTS